MSQKVEITQKSTLNLFSVLAGEHLNKSHPIANIEDIRRGNTKKDIQDTLAVSVKLNNLIKRGFGTYCFATFEKLYAEKKARVAQLIINTTFN